jgi:phytoene desaturase
MPARSVIIIGAGIGGIAAAAHLAQKGIHVTVFEKNSHAGGRCDYFSREGHHFDVGPTLMVMPLLYEAEFKALGSNLHEILDLKRVDPTYRLVFDDSSSISLTSDLKAMRAQLETLEPGSFDGYLRYLAEGNRHYQVAMEKLVNRDFRKASEFFSLGNLPLLFSVKPLIPHYRNMSNYFQSARLKAAFTFQDVYMGLSPFEAPATFSMMSYTELAHGVFYPKGGMFQVIEALMAIARQAGVEFVFDADVERIEVKDNAAKGIILKGNQRISADVILANADLPYVYKELLPDSDLAEQLTHKRFSCSAISFFWGVDRLIPALGAHTLFLADDYRANFKSIIQDLDLPDNPSLYVHAPARLDPTKAPQGQDTLIAIVPVGHLDDSDKQDWENLCQRARQVVFARLSLLGITDLEAHIKFEVNLNPLSWRKRYNLMKGATHGLSHNLLQLGYLRPHNRHPRYHNLYFTGASTHPGTGMPTALVSARLAARRILDDLNLPA